MTSLVKVLETEEGVAHIITRSRWLYVFPLCYTSVVPTKWRNLVGKGTFIRWNTDDSTRLASLHDAVIRLVDDVGIAGLAEIADREKRTHRMAKAMGISYRELCDEAIRSRTPIPVLDDVLGHVKKFM